MRTSIALPIAAALAAFAVGASGAAFAAPLTSAAFISDGLAEMAPIAEPAATYVYKRRHPEAKRVIRAGRNYDKTPNRKQVVINGKRVPVSVTAGPVVRDHRTKTTVVRDHRTTATVVRDHRATATGRR